MKIVVGSDKAGYPLKESIIEMLKVQGHEILDAGTTDPEQPRPHNVTGPAAAELLKSGEAERGILICGTGMGMAMAANKNKGVYAAVVESVYAAEYSRKINDANVLCLGAFLVGETMAKEMVNVFLKTEFVQDFPEWRVDFLTKQKEILETHEEQVFK
ncbi:MAG: RpiB/LacA/LacB family sugar-phosphate isomerase [Lachnospiraceae bacterium]|nr:RpiB/LacA/LacB family sugar-phosphate isomerase [Lachnospiraceae bacterium]